MAVGREGDRRGEGQVRLAALDRLLTVGPVLWPSCARRRKDKRERDANSLPSRMRSGGEATVAPDYGNLA